MRRIGAWLLVIGTCVACGQQTSSAGPADDSSGCGSAAPEIHEDGEWTSFGEQFSARAPDPLRVAPVPDVIPRLGALVPPLTLERAALLGWNASEFRGQRSVTAYYAVGVVNGLLPGELYRAGGLRLEAVQLQSGSEMAEVGPQVVRPDRQTAVAIGEHPGVIIWDDPQDPTEVRSHTVTWSDGTWEYRLSREASAEATIATARSLVCP